jgi:hypothetical protein
VNLKKDHGIFLRKEIHARDLIAGRGRISDRVISKWQRSRIFHGMLSLVGSLPNMMIFNVCLPQAGHADPQLVAWDRLMNRAERTMLEFENRETLIRKSLLADASKGLGDRTELLETRLNIYRSRAVVLADEGREHEITKAVRKMHRFNPIPSMLGAWSSGKYTKSITIDRIIEDPVFKQSDRSYFIQLADCVAFALLKREVPPTPRVLKYGINEMFDEVLSSVCFKPASPGDPLGIVRH